MPQTVDLLREYLAAHPHAEKPTAPFFPAFKMQPPRSTGLRTRTADGTPDSRDPRHVALRQASALAALTTVEHEARLTLDWDVPLRHLAFYKSLFRPAVLRAGLSPDLRFS